MRLRISVGAGMEISLHYEETGEGEPLVLLHGNGEDGSYFSAQTAFFQKYYRVIAVDTRGHGKSPRGTAPFTMAQFAADLKGLLDGLGIRTAHLLGFSDGANIAMTFALRYPEYLKSLILNGGNISPWGVKLSVQIPILLGYGLVSVIALFDRKAVLKKEILGLMVHEPDIRPEELGRISAPALVIAGRKDMIRESHTRLIQKSIPGSRLCIMEGTHFIAAEKPEEFNQHILGFLEPPGRNLFSRAADSGSESVESESPGAAWSESVFESRR